MNRNTVLSVYSCLCLSLLGFCFVHFTNAQTADIRTLVSGQILERELSGGRSHDYKIKVTANQYLKIIVEQKGIDVVVELYLPDGKKLIEVDSPNGTQGPEPVELIAPIGGDYSLKVRSLEDKAPSGKYEVKVVELRDTTEKDKQDKEVTVLELGKLIERKLAGDEAHSYYVALTANQYLYLVVYQRGIDVVVTLFGPDGKKVTEVDSPNYWQGPEPLSVVAETTGNYRLEVRSLEKTAIAGHYDVKIFELRTATEKDKNRAAAERAFNQAQMMEAEGSVQSLQSAIMKYEESLPFFHAVGDIFREALALYYIARIYDSFGELHNALDYYFKTLPFTRAVKYIFAEAEVLNNIGGVYDSLGERQKALDYYAQALPLRRAAQDRNGEAATYSHIGAVYYSLGEMQIALDYYEKALPLYRAVGDQSGESSALNNIGSVYESLGEKQKALDNYNKALTLDRATGNRSDKANTLSNIGGVYESSRDTHKALEYYEQALLLSRTVGDRRTEATTLNSIGNAYSYLGEKLKALDYYAKALPIFRAVENRTGEAMTLNNIGVVYHDLGEKQKALDYYKNALRLNRGDEDRRGEASTLFNFASLESGTGNLVEALSKIEDAISIIESLRTKIGSHALRISYFATVQKYYEFYIDLLMRLHKQKPSENYVGKALEASELSRARGLLELLSEANVNIRQGVDEKLLETERNLQQRISARTDARIRLLNSKHTQEQEDKINKEIKELTDEYEKTEAQIRTTSPRYAALAQPQPLTLTDIQKKVLDKDTILLEYALGAERSYLWVVTQDSIESYELPKGETINNAARAFNKTISKRPTAATKKEYATAAQTLSDILLKPAADHLQNNKRLLIVGDGVLQYIPFAALPKPSSNSQVPSSKLKNSVQRTAYSVRLLVADHEIISLPSASTIAVLRDEKNVRTKNAKEIMVVADPVFETSDLRLKKDTQTNSETKTVSPTATKDRSFQTFLRSLNLNNETTVESPQPIPRLSYTRREALTIAALVPKTQSKIYLDFDANYANATNLEAGQYRFIHFGTHGLLNSEQPELTGILFSMVDEKGNPQPQSLLRLGEIYNLKLPVELVVLSGCQTAIGKEIKGEGLVGLTRGFMYAGSPRVVASLWKVDDAMTAEVMKHFYEAMLGAKRLAPAAALRQAQKEMLRQKIEPFYWAAFIMQGEWR